MIFLFIFCIFAPTFICWFIYLFIYFANGLLIHFSNSFILRVLTPPPFCHEIHHTRCLIISFSRSKHKSIENSTSESSAVVKLRVKEREREREARTEISRWLHGKERKTGRCRTANSGNISTWSKMNPRKKTYSMIECCYKSRPTVDNDIKAPFHVADATRKNIKTVNIPWVHLMTFESRDHYVNDVISGLFYLYRRKVQFLIFFSF